MRDNPDLSFEKAFEEAMNGPILKKAQALGIKKEDIKIISLDSCYDSTPEAVGLNFFSYFIDKEQLEKNVEAICKTLTFSDSDCEDMKDVFFDYLKDNLVCYSPQTYNEALKRLHELILIKAGADKDPSIEDKIVYVTPTNILKCYNSRNYYDSDVKSDSYLAYIFSKVNDVPLDKFIDYEEWYHTIPDDDKIYVVLDDFAGCGASLRRIFDRKEFFDKQNEGEVTPIKNIIFAPMVSSGMAYERWRNFRDYSIVTTKVIEPVKFYIERKDKENLNMASRFGERRKNYGMMLDKLFCTQAGELMPHQIENMRRCRENPYAKENYRFAPAAETAVALPYMVPDNNPHILNNYIFKYFTPNSAGVKNLKSGPVFDEINKNLQ